MVSSLIGRNDEKRWARSKQIAFLFVLFNLFLTVSQGSAFRKINTDEKLKVGVADSQFKLVLVAVQMTENVPKKAEKTSLELQVNTAVHLIVNVNCLC